MLLCSTWVALDNQHGREALLLLGLCVTLSLSWAHCFLVGAADSRGSKDPGSSLFVCLAWLVPAGAFSRLCCGEEVQQAGQVFPSGNGSQRLAWRWKGRGLEASQEPPPQTLPSACTMLPSTAH